MWEILLSNADWDCFRTQTLREILKIQNPLLEEHYAFSEVIQFVPTSWMCKKQTSVSHSSTESEIISLDTGLRLDGLPALELWDLIVSVFGNVSHISDRTGKPVNGKKTNLIIKSMLCMTLIWFPQMFNPQVVKLYCMCLRTMRL